MNLVDSCGWLEYIADGPNAHFFAKPLEQTSRLVAPTICVYEVFRRLLDQVGRGTALEAVASMRHAIIVPLTHSLAVEAGGIARAFRLPLADSVILATARAWNATLWTQDVHFSSVEGVRYVPAKTP